MRHWLAVQCPPATHHQQKMLLQPPLHSKPWQQQMPQASQALLALKQPLLHLMQPRMLLNLNRPSHMALLLQQHSLL